MSRFAFGRIEGVKDGKIHRLARGVRMWRPDHAPGGLSLYRAVPDSSLSPADVTCKTCLKRSERKDA